MEHIVRCSSVATTNICKGLRFKRNVSLLLLVLLSINLLFGCGYEMIADEHLSFAHTISESKKVVCLGADLYDLAKDISVWLVEFDEMYPDKNDAHKDIEMLDDVTDFLWKNLLESNTYVLVAEKETMRLIYKQVYIR